MTKQDETTVWRMMTHHQDSKYALEWVKETKRIAIGWGRIGDIKTRGYSSNYDISKVVKEFYPDRRDASDGGYSLYDFCYSMRSSDLVILNAERKRALVVEVVGDYEYKPLPEEPPLGDYQHQRQVNILKKVNADDLWRSAGSHAVAGRSVYGALVECRKPIDVATRMTLDESYNPAAYTSQVYVSADEVDAEAVYKEGAVRQAVVNAYERNSQARRQCIAHYGARCGVCKLDFDERYGEVGVGFIHVHHLRPLSEIGAQYEVDPVADLRPVCPNCHAIIHRRNPPYSIEEVKAMLR